MDTAKTRARTRVYHTCQEQIVLKREQEWLSQDLQATWVYHFCQDQILLKRET